MPVEQSDPMAAWCWEDIGTCYTLLARLTPGSFLLLDQLGGQLHCPWSLPAPLPPGLLTGRVGVPGLPAVVAELHPAVLAAADEPGTLCAAVGNDRIAKGKSKR